MPTDVATDALDGYALALLAVAQGEGMLDHVEDELFRVARAFERSDQLRSTLTDRAIPVERRQAIVEDLLGQEGGTTVTKALVSFLVAAERASQIPAIVDAFMDAAAASRQHVVAEVRSAVDLDDDRQRQLAEALSRATGLQVEVKVVVDSTVVGGIVTSIGDRVIDGSVRSRLRELRETL